nr:enhanced serine sensitivity protein SseB C-terminal domain-containing protein [Sphingomonas leidyi]
MMTAARDPAARPDFERMLLEAELYVATPEAPAEASVRTVGAGETLQILNVADPQGNPIPAIFTSEARLAELFGAGSGYARLPAKTLFEMFARSGAWLNPGLAYGVLWSADDLAHLLGKPVRRTIAKETSILLGTPARRPEALIRSIVATVADSPTVQEAWLALAQWPEGNASWYLDIRSAAEPDAIAALLRETLQSGPHEGMPVDLVVNAPGSGPGHGIRLKPGELH